MNETETSVSLIDTETTPQAKKKNRRHTVLTRVDKELRDQMRLIALRDGITMSRTNDKALRRFLECEC